MPKPENSQPQPALAHRRPVTTMVKTQIGRRTHKFKVGLDIDVPGARPSAHHGGLGVCFCVSGQRSSVAYFFVSMLFVHNSISLSLRHVRMFRKFCAGRFSSPARTVSGPPTRGIVVLCLPTCRCSRPFCLHGCRQRLLGFFAGEFVSRCWLRSG